MNTIYITRRETFNAAHKLWQEEWSEEKNWEVFGKCSNANWHGHNFELFVTIKGQPDPQTGFIFDAKKLSSIVRERIVDKVDHRNLNVDVDFMQGKLCSIEHFVMAIWKELEPALPPQVKLHALKLIETPRIYVEYFGE